MKKSIITTIAFLACTLCQANTDAATYIVTSDGVSKFRVQFTTMNLYSFHRTNTQDFVTGCNEARITQTGVTTGVKIFLKRATAIKADDADLVHVTLTQSVLQSVREVSTETCTVQVPDVKTFAASANIQLPASTKQLIAKDSATGEQWFIERSE